MSYQGADLEARFTMQQQDHLMAADLSQASTEQLPAGMAHPPLESQQAKFLASLIVGHRSLLKSFISDSREPEVSKIQCPPSSPEVHEEAHTEMIQYQ